jgi:hypothetical protein
LGVLRNSRILTGENGHARDRPGFRVHPQFRPLPNARATRADRRLQPRPDHRLLPVSPDEYEEFKRFRESRRTFATAALSEQSVERIRASHMDVRHARLDKLLDPK